LKVSLADTMIMLGRQVRVRQSSRCSLQICKECRAPVRQVHDERRREANVQRAETLVAHDLHE
jgi:hypothetical protein